MYENSVSIYVSTTHQLFTKLMLPKLTFLRKAIKKNNREQTLFAVTEDTEGFFSRFHCGNH